ncbi:hypothetical protein MUK70_13145 [Dyadobacter chenwenxiniae]|uniref:DUF4175 domain-containing protein n=1 Tax=Dyadobacter chenwenxiniae TaxID=2906456 RepID=A0A9X1TBS8_9BACT|nr:DUF4175 family protein [Dyadobacter chenwenxiniae]MCF0060191.1 hypothetical protein [Dyadobacter chenwenxiniae]UON85928.1 hypothetical protein MUK70_13145 [Dyadobacter chenwenxiniae]
MHELRKMIGLVTNQLYASALLRCLLLAGTAYVFTSTFAGPSHPASIAAAFAGLCAGFLLSGIYKNNRNKAISLIHNHVGETEYSLHLLEKPDLNIAEQLQLERITNRGYDFPFSKLYSGLTPYLGILLTALAFHFIHPTIFLGKKAEDSIQKQLGKSAKVNVPTPPEIEWARIYIAPPDYTTLPDRQSNDLNISSIAGSALTWKVKFTHSENLVLRLTNSRGEEIPFQKQGNLFTHSDKITGSGLYAMKGYWKDSLVYQSDFYRLEALPDLAPKIEPASKDLYKYHMLQDAKTIKISAKISDDFRVKQAFIVATLARGSGENVKFREVKFPLSPTDFKEANLHKEINLNELNFSPGDELYYYWAAFDNKSPQANFSKSDTYFLVYKDTSNVEEAELATMAVNIMPEYFRSQRQIIIDTEKLIARRRKLPQKEFASISNEIGFDQKVLRLRYGQYLGEEFETSIGGGGVPEAAIPSGENMLDAFTHKSDAAGEATERGVTERGPTERGPTERGSTEPAHKGDHDGHDHGKGHEETGEKDPLAALMEQYVHAHDDAETNTFYEQSTRSLLKMALEQMWQSELHLRLYEPEKALPFEHKALEYLKSAQHKARTYVKKSGYDPPPIKETEKRLSGELKEISNDLNAEKFYREKTTAQLAAAISGFLDYTEFNNKQRSTLRLAGGTLSGRLINSEPFNGGLGNWEMIGLLQKLVSGKTLSSKEKQHLKMHLLRYTNHSEQSRRGYSSEKKLEDAFWKKIQ